MIVKPFTQADSDNFFQTPHNAKNLGWLFGQVFGGDRAQKLHAFPQEYLPIVAEAVEAALLTLTPREEKVLRLRLGLNLREKHFTQEVLPITSVCRVIGFVRSKAERCVSCGIHQGRAASSYSGVAGRRIAPILGAAIIAAAVGRPWPVIETIKRVEPGLIAHLKQNNDDLNKINPLLFEHLFAEFLATRGFDDVRLVGHNTKTSADIFAAKFIPGPEIPIKFFVEVKRWKDTIGIGVINQVLGAFLGERERFGRNAALLLTVGGFRDFENGRARN